MKISIYVSKNINKKKSLLKLMTDTFLKSFSTLRGNKTRNKSFQSNTLPSNDCSNGFPIDK